MATATAPTTPTPHDGSRATLLVRESAGRRLRNHLATVLVYACFLIALVPLVWILWTVISRGAGLLAEPTWWTNSQRGITARRVGGGAYHAIIGTLLMAVVTAAIAVPIALGTAITWWSTAGAGSPRSSPSWSTC